MKPVSPPDQLVTVADAIAPERIQLNLRSSHRDDLLCELVPLVIGSSQGRLAERLFKALKEREDMCPTCLGEGIAIPHARNAMVGLVNQPVLAYGRHPTGVNFGALDGVPVRHFFLLCAPNVREHLQLLARLARLVHNPQFRAKLDAAQKPQDVCEAIGQMETNPTKVS